MTKRFILLVGLMMCAGVVSADPLVKGNADAGKQKAATCAGCHGPKGNMQSAQFPKLAGQSSTYIYEQLKLFKSGKRKNAIMAGQAAGLSDEDMKNLATYFSSQQTRPGAADASIAPAGAAIYHGGKPDDGVPACSGCHGPSGLGNAAAKYPRLSGQNPQYIVTQLTAYRDGTRSGYHNATVMNGVAEHLSDNDIKALASYVTGLAPSKKNASNDQGALMQNASGPTDGSKSGEAGKKPAAGQAGPGQDKQAKPAEGADTTAAKANKKSGKSGAGSQGGSPAPEDDSGNKPAAGTQSESSSSQNGNGATDNSQTNSAGSSSEGSSTESNGGTDGNQSNSAGKGDTPAAETPSKNSSSGGNGDGATDDHQTKSAGEGDTSGASSGS